MPSREFLERHYGPLYKRPEGISETECFYCGDRATCTDHVPALSTVDVLSPKRLVGHRLLLIPACTHCNSILSNKMYLDVKTRACFLIGEMIEVVGRQEIKVISMDDDVSGDKHIAEKTLELLLDKLKFLACVFDRYRLIEKSEPLSNPKLKWSKKQAIAHADRCRREYVAEILGKRAKTIELEECVDENDCEIELHDAHVGAFLSDQRGLHYGSSQKSVRANRGNKNVPRRYRCHKIDWVSAEEAAK